AIIMDGNGRWAKSRHLPRLAGHRAGVQPVRESVRACDELGVQALTLYAFSVENWNRPRAEINGLMQALKDTLRREQPELNENGVRLRTIGRIHDLPWGVRRQIEQTTRALGDNTGMVLNLALSYGGRPELADAARAIAEDVRAGRLDPSDVDEAALERRLYTAGLPDPDLLIRTSGELRVSNFLLWQIAYAEIWVTETPWPEFGREQLYSAILDFQRRDRRFGRVESARPEVPSLTS
ncbi:MAG: isoprenyl transferase, partial [Gemmatimonadetes bacterium]|nr:isoprenyl transferase [Gemmatimonadota bacterium]